MSGVVAKLLSTGANFMHIPRPDLRLLSGLHEHCQGKGELPLDGIRILDLTRVLAGPYCTMVLGDLGAEIIKVERTGVGDITRHWGPPFCGTESAYFLSVNRNKKSLTLDLRKAEAITIMKKLIAGSDVLVENYIPGKLSQFGLGYEDVKLFAPRLIYCSITGYGQTGPYSKRAGYDVTAAALGGLLHITGPEDGGPCRTGVAVTDLCTGLHASGSIMAAILQRQKTGLGQHIDCNLLATQVAMLCHIVSNYLNAGQEARRYGTGHSSIVPYQAFQTRDSYVIVGAGDNSQFKVLCKHLELADLPIVPKYASNALRVENRVELLDILSKRFLEKTTGEWLAVFEDCGIPYAPVNNIEQVSHSGMIQEMNHPTVGSIKVPGPAVRYSNFDSKRSAIPPPTLSQNSREILTDILKYSQTEIDEFIAKKVV